MLTYLFFKYKNEDYKFPIGTNILTGKLLRKLIKQYMYPTIILEKYSRIWIGGHYVSDESILIYNGDGGNGGDNGDGGNGGDDGGSVEHVILFTDKWGVSEENGLIVPSIVTINVDDVTLYIE